MIRRVGVRFGVASSDLDDFVQETLYRAYARRQQIREADRVQAWLFAIARNAARDWAKKRVPAPVEDAVGLLERDHRIARGDDGESSELLGAAMDRLSESDRTLLYDYYVKGVEYPELQQRLGITYGAVGVRLHTARERLRREMRRQEPLTVSPGERFGFASCVYADRVYLIGGQGKFMGVCLNSVEVYDPNSDTWVRRTPIPTARRFAPACPVADAIYVIGGSPEGYQPSLPTVERYDPATDRWTRCADMPTARARHTLSVANGRIYAIGGYTSPVQCQGISAVEEYDPQTDTWRRRSDMPTPRFAASAAVVRGRIFIFGGMAHITDPLPLPTVEEYDPATDRWARKVDTPTMREGAEACVVGEDVYLIGGWELDSHRFTKVIFGTVERYDPATDTWTTRADMPTPRAYFGSSVVGGHIYTFGGISTPYDLASIQGDPVQSDESDEDA